MKVFLSLFRIYSAGIFSPSSFLGNFRKGPKGVAKGLGIILLGAYVLASLGFVFFWQSLAAYRALDAADLDALYPLVFLESTVRASFIAFFLGFVNVLASYFVSGAETFLLSLPIRPWQHFGAKFALSWTTQLLLSAVIIGISAGTWAWFARPAPAFYAYAALSALSLPLIPLALSWFILVPLLSTAKFLRKKETLTVLAGFIGVALILAWQVAYQKFAAMSADPAWIVKNLKDPNTILSRFGGLYPPARWAAAALSGAGSASGLGNAGLLLLAQCLAAAAAVLLLSRAYVRSLATFNESSIRKLEDAGRYIGKGFARRHGLLACLLREIRLMNREPVYFLNGPFVILLLPLVYAIMFLASRETFLPLLYLARDPALGDKAMVAIMAVCAFLGTASSIACSAVSREGKGLRFIQSLPLDPRSYFLAKYLHAEVFALLAALLLLLISIILGFPPSVAVGGALPGFLLASLLNLLDLGLDTAFPRLGWTSPVAAMKQNPNTLLGILGGMALIALACLPGFLRGIAGWTAIVGAASLALSALGLALYLPWAAHRLSRMSP